ncbi:hypothetical protein S40288_11074 [Stachybotrys chartarum IBT 40288]|nr:hypothetical protein S40288_11074 [Stachybotrys chartarum IBT 40288]
MDRDKDARATRPNGRPAGLVVKPENRKPLFAKPQDDGAVKSQGPASRSDGGRFRGTVRSTPLHGRRTNSESNPPPPPSERRGSNSSVASSGSTRIPRPSSTGLTQRREMKLAEAFKLAEREEQEQEQEHPADASPSPAPRMWRARPALDQRKTRSTPGEEYLGAKGRLKDLKGKPEEGPVSHDAPRAAVSNENRKSMLPEKSQSGIFGKSNGGATPSVRDRGDKNRPLSGLFGRRSPLKTAAPNDDGGIPPLVPGIEDFPLPSIEGAAQPDDGVTPAALQPPVANSIMPSPEKSFGWLDQDFTAGDLQVSDSPRIRVRSQPFANRIAFDESSNVDINSRNRVNPPGTLNTKLDDIRRLEVKEGVDQTPVERPRRNTKLEDILAREAQAEQQIPIPDRHISRLQNTKLDDIRQREVDGISPRVLAGIRLEEIREQNSMSRSLSPEEQRPRSSEGPLSKVDTNIVSAAEPPVRPKSAFEAGGGERIPDTPVTIFKCERRRSSLSQGVERENDDGKRDVDLPTARPLNTRADSKEVLQRLARVASNSPSLEHEPRRSPTPPLEKPPVEKASLRARITTRHSENSKRPSAPDIKEPANPRPTVGFAEFAGLRRVRSTESTRSKRSSLHSEGDPIDRIEAEAKLFAPLDNYSERGSVRAPSPPPDGDDQEEEEEEEDEVEATPRPKRQDPLTMPTPKVTGAYVETPATVKVEDRMTDRVHARPEELRVEHAAALETKSRATVTRRPSKDRDTASDPGTDEKAHASSTSADVSRPRARSLPRRRPPLRNSAKPPSVKDDLLELQRAHNIEDSTLDDLEDILSGRKSAMPKLEEALQQLLPNGAEQTAEPKAKPTNEEDAKAKNKMTEEISDSELAVIDRMSRSLRTGLMGIRTAKEGIARLEDKVSHADTALQKTADVIPEKPAARPAPIEPDDSQWMYLRLPVPRLYRRGPYFKLTWAGLIAFALALWLLAESSMCAAFCRPQSCSSEPCVWAYDDPTFGRAIPVKLDQWATGGYGRKKFAQLSEEFVDWLADVEDLAYGQDITDRNPEQMTFMQRRQHRRRLLKKGIVKNPVSSPTPEQKAKWDAWHQARLARERAWEAREMGYEVGDVEDASVGGDRRVG